MLALTTRVSLQVINSTRWPRCYTTEDAPSRLTMVPGTWIYYNRAATTGASCGYGGYKCACQCYHPSPPPPPLPAPPPTPPPPPDMCECTGNGNQMSCSGTGVRYCGGGEECFATTKVPYGQWDDMCRQSDRRLQQSSA